MTKVEELRGKIIDMAQGVSFADIGMFLHLLDEYYAEGVAEGHHDGFHEGYRDGVAERAKQFRLQILDDEGTPVESFCEQDVYVVRVEILDKPAVLAPTKESPHSQWHDSVIGQKAQP